MVRTLKHIVLYLVLLTRIDIDIDPYEKFNPLGLGNSGKQHAVMGGEWESATVSPLIIHPCRALKYDQSQCRRMEGSTLRICMVSWCGSNSSHRSTVCFLNSHTASILRSHHTHHEHEIMTRDATLRWYDWIPLIMTYMTMYYDDQKFR